VHCDELSRGGGALLLRMAKRTVQRQALSEMAVESRVERVRKAGQHCVTRRSCKVGDKEGSSGRFGRSW
jgi:hypothetical protein